MDEYIRLQEQLQDLIWRNSLRGLSAKEKDAQTQARVNELLAEAIELENKRGGTTEDTIEAMQKRVEAERLLGQLSTESESHKAVSARLFSADQLARVGGQTGIGAGLQSWKGDIRAIRDVLTRKGIKVYDADL